MTEIKKFVDLKVIKVISFMMIPLVLILVTGELRPSISDYAYSEQAKSFTCLLTLAGMTFFEDGYADRKRYYNMLLGTALITVAWTPHLDYTIQHFSSAATFYVGSIVFMWIYTSNNYLVHKLLITLVTVIGMLLHFVAGLYNLLIAEWIGMFPICFIFVSKATGKIE